MRSQNLAHGLALLAAAVVAAGCTAHARATGYAEADAPVVNIDNPSLVEVDAGVWVIRDYDEPVYFVNDDYWVFRSGVWYRSHGYDGGWARVEATVVPAVIVRRDHRAYVHYHGPATAQVRVAPRRHRDGDRHDEGEHHGPPEHAGEPHGGHGDHDEGRGPGNERKTEERHEGHGENERAEHHEGHDHDEGRAGDNQHRGDEGRGGGKKSEKDRGKKR